MRLSCLLISRNRVSWSPTSRVKHFSAYLSPSAEVTEKTLAKFPELARGRPSLFNSGWDPTSSESRKHSRGFWSAVA